MIRLLVVDDHPVLLQGVKAVCENAPEIDAVATASSTVEALATARLAMPDVALLDVDLGEETDGIDLGRTLMEASAACRILMFSAYEDERTVRRAIEAGVAGFVVKTAASDQLIAAISDVATGQGYIDPRLVVGVLNACAKPPQRRPRKPIEFLTPQECRVLRLIGQGLSNPEIAEELYISVVTVKSHVNRVFRKLGVRDRPQAILVAVGEFGSMA